jgi:hypothetical protein
MATQRGPILVLAVRHRPFEIATLLTVFLSTVINLVTGNTQTLRAINTLLPGYEWVWSIGVLIGSGLALLSAFLSIPNNLLLERIGLFLLGMLFFGYAVVAITVIGLIGFSGAFFLLMFGGACAFRVIQLNRDIRLLKGMGAARDDN